MYPESQMHGDENLMSDHEVSVFTSELHDNLVDAITEQYEYFASDFDGLLNFPLDVDQMEVLLRSKTAKCVAVSIIDDLTTQLIEKYDIEKCEGFLEWLRSI